MYWLALPMLLAAIVLLCWPSSFTAYVDARGFHVDGVVLSPHRISAGVLYTGPATVLVRSAAAAVEITAAASLGGTPASGLCRVSGTSALCRFSVGGSLIRSVDQFSVAEHEWIRRYSDGLVVSIQVPQGAQPLPIPLPLGAS